MPWKVAAVSEVRFALCHAVRTLHRPVAAVAREFGVSRKTAHKWLDVFDALGGGGGGGGGVTAAALDDRSRRPARSPGRTPDDAERRVLHVRDRYHWGPRKIRAFLLQEAQRRGEPAPPLPSVRTLGAILARHGRIPVPGGGPSGTPPVQRFERDAPNQLWQVDHKGPFEVARRPVTPLTVIDDHSRYCLAFRRTPDRTMAAAFAVLWDVFADAGLPEAVLTDNAFNAPGIAAPGLSWFDARLIRLGIRPTHGRPYHPQTQGKCERFHATAARELIYFNARRDADAHFDADTEAWRGVYNALRPHEALGDVPPVARWAPSPRKRPATLPDVAYDAGATVRKIGSCGEVSFRGYTILVGRGLAGDHVRVEEHGREVRVFYCWKQVRSLSAEQLVKGRML
jgi:transposase InsO family protein